MKHQYLEKYRQEIYRCVRCGGCQPSCPTYTFTGDESMVARGRMALIEAFIDERLDLTDGFEDRIGSCLDCKACVKSCPGGVKVDEIIYATKAEISSKKYKNPVRRYLAKKSLILTGQNVALLKLAGFVKRYIYDFLPAWFPIPSSLKAGGKKRLLPNIGDKLLREEYHGLLKVDKPKGRVAFFVGCATNSIHQHIGKAVIDVLTHNRIEVLILEDEVCCGIPFLSKGDRITAEELIEKNLDVFASLDVDAVITCCATCGATLKDYSVWTQDERAKKLSLLVTDIHGYLVHHTNYKRGLGKLDKKVTWHDPCHLSRGQGIMDEPREILESIPGLEFLEMKKPCQCCGFGGEVSIRKYDMSIGIAGEKVNSIKDSGAEELATGCPACKIHLEDALNHFGARTPVLHTVEYLAQAYKAGKKRS